MLAVALGLVQANQVVAISPNLWIFWILGLFPAIPSSSPAKAMIELTCSTDVHVQENLSASYPCPQNERVAERSEVVFFSYTN